MLGGSYWGWTSPMVNTFGKPLSVLIGISIALLVIAIVRYAFFDRNTRERTYISLKIRNNKLSTLVNKSQNISYFKHLNASTSQLIVKNNIAVAEDNLTLGLIVLVKFDKNINPSPLESDKFSFKTPENEPNENWISPRISIIEHNRELCLFSLNYDSPKDGNVQSLKINQSITIEFN